MPRQRTDCHSTDGLVASLSLKRAAMRTQMRTAQRGSNPVTWNSTHRGHQGLVELARCRSDLFSASSLSRRARKLVGWVAQAGTVDAVLAAGAAAASGLVLK
jgi:hypothetical protein